MHDRSYRLRSANWRSALSEQSTIIDRIAAGADGAAGDRCAGAPAAHPWRPARPDAADRGALNALGIGRGDRVAIVLPNGPEMATAFVAVAAGATTAPLNPAYRADEFDFYLTDLGAKAILVAPATRTGRRSRSPSGSASPILRLDAGRRRGRPGRFALDGEPRSARRRGRAGRGRTTSRWCCTPPARRRGRRSCR